MSYAGGPPGGSPPGGRDGSNYPSQGYPPQGYPPQGYPPQGYPPQGYPPQGYPPQGNPGYPGYPSPYGYGAPRRSAIPKVMGILMIIFGGLGILSALVGLATGGGFGMPSGPGAMDKLREELTAYTQVTNGISLPLAIFHLVAGVWAVLYKRAAPLLATTYATLAMLNQVLAAFLLFSWYLPAMERLLPSSMAGPMRMGMMVGFVFGLIIGLTWPVLVLILMRRPAAMEACVN